MASLNIAEWTAEQVAEWMAGLGPKVAQYVPELHKQGLNGTKLLTLRCDDLEYLGIHIIGHQELLLEAVDHLRNFHYEISRECVQQLALRVSSAAASLARALQHHADARLETHSLADVARTVHAVKPLVCWLDRWPLCSGSPLAERKAALLKLSLEAATCAQRDRFAEQPARAVAAAARAVHNVADYIIQDVSDPMILQPASLDTVSLKQGEKPLGFEVVPSFCGHHQLAHIRFASPAHASGLVHEADEIVQVGGKCVIGWSGEAVERLCIDSARSTGELQLRLRRRGARALPALPTPPLRAPRPRAARLRLPPAPLHAHLRLRYDLDFPRAELTPTAKIAQTETTIENPRTESPHSSSDESEPLSPPASPTQLHLDTARLYPPKPALATARRHSVCGGSPLSKRPPVTIEHFWQELQQRRWDHAGTPDTDDSTLYRRDKAVSCSTGLQLSPRPRTCLGVPRPLANQHVNQPMVTTPTSRGKLDKSHSTPAYDFEQTNEPSSLTNQTIPESPTTPTDSPLPKAGQILDFKKSSTQIEEAIQQRNRKIHDDDKDVFTDTKLTEDSKLEIVETVNTILSESVKVSERVQKERESEEKMSKTSDDTSSDDIPIPVKYPKPRITERYKPSDVPPEPPPRPSHTQRHQNPVPPPREIPPREHPIPPPRESLFREPYRESLRELSRERDHVIQTWEAISSVPLVRDATTRESAAVQHPVLRMIPRQNEARDVSPLKPIRPGDATQISVPLRHITKHDIKLISTERRELPPINGDPDPPPADKPRRDDIVIGAASEQNLADSSPKSGALSPTGSVVRGIFPSSKSRSLKKKNSILAKRRDVSARSLAARGAAGRVWQRVRARAAAQARWASRHLLLAHNLLYAYRSPDCNRADCMIYLEGFTVCAAGEVKSRAHAFKVYHTGVAFYFACDTRDAMLAWIQLIHRATLLPSLKPNTMELSKQFSETDYSETESDTETSERRSEKEREREKEREKDKSKFGSLKKLAHRAGRSESHENVSQAATSLDRKYLRFFSRAKAKDDKAVKNKQSGMPLPTEHYRSYRRVTQEIPSTPSSPMVPSSPAPPSISTSSPPPVSKKLPKPINYIHASNPNLLDFEKSDFVTKPAIQVPKPKVHKPDNFIGFVTLEEFMLKKQEEERQQVYTNRVLMGIERDRKEDKKAAMELQKRLDKIVPDVIYGVSSGDLPLPVLEIQSRGLPPAPVNVQSSPVMAREGGKPISVKGKDGYETIVYPEEREEREKQSERGERGERDERERRVEAWRASLRRADRVHSGSPHTPPTPASNDSWSSSVGASGGGGGSAVSGASIGVSRLRLMFSGARRELQRQESNRLEQYPHLQCPPTFQPESYSLSRPPRDPPPQPPHRD